jgi:hypothetical protein
MTVSELVRDQSLVFRPKLNPNTLVVVQESDTERMTDQLVDSNAAKVPDQWR